MSIELTVPTFNSCTESMGSPGILQDLTPERPTSFPGMDARATLQLNVTLIRKLLGSCFFDQAQADVRSTGAGNKCLYCIYFRHATVTMARPRYVRH